LEISMPRFSANLGFLWAERPLLERIDAAAAAGFKAVELHFPYATPPGLVADRCAARGVELLGINTDVAPERGESGLAAVPGRGADARALVDRAVDWVSAAGGAAVHVMAGKVPPERRAEGRAALLDTLAYAADRAEEAGLVILLEPLNPDDMPGYFYSRVEEAAEVIDRLGRPQVRLMFDCYHVGRVGEDITAALRTCFPLVAHIQFAAVPSRAEPDEGDVDYATIFREIDGLGWPGWVGAEYRPRGAVEDGLGWVAALGQRLGPMHGGQERPG
jgi:2-dehydrotetronate isomerase